MKNTKKYNLIELLSEFKVRIPMLQRDFAHGRNKQSIIRENFLTSLFKFLSDNSLKEKSLDFIYGYEEDEDFLPIDGQQRLTTLWLLYIYLSSRVSDKSRYTVLTKFTYATRDNAGEFCEAITSFKFTDTPSKQLKDATLMKSFISSGDPTILSMITMLDAIHEKFCDISSEDFLHRLDSVKFYVVNMEEFNLGEDLYIKMNSRGKQLSLFENFKSWIQKDPEVEKDAELLASIDNNWINFFWKRSNDNGKQNNNDWEENIAKMMGYFAIFFALQKVNQEEKPENDGLAKVIEKILNHTSGIFDEKLYMLAGENLFTHVNLKKTDKVINCLCKYEIFFLPDEKTPSFLIPKLFALFFYVLSDENINDYDDWKKFTDRVINNYRARDNFKHLIAIFKLLENFSPYCADIVNYLASDPQTSSNYAKERIDEEKLKAKLIVADGRNGEWEKVISKAHENKYFNGWIDFLFMFSCDKNDEYSIEDFKKYSNVMCALFKLEFLQQQRNLNLLQRSLLSIDNYSCTNSHSYLGSSSSDLQDGMEQWSKIFKEKDTAKKLAIQLLDFKLDTEGDVELALENIISKNLLEDWPLCEYWRYLMVRDADYLSYCNKNRFYYSKNDKESFPIVYLIPSMRFVTYGKNLLSYGLYRYLIQNYAEILSPDFNDKIHESFCFKIGNLSILQMREWGNVIKIEKRKSVIGEFTLEDGGYYTIDAFYKDISNFILDQGITK